MNYEIVKDVLTEFTTERNENSHFSVKYKTNVRGVYKVEWWSPPYCGCLECITNGSKGGHFGFSFLEYGGKRKTQKGKDYFLYRFDDKKEAEDYYKKHSKNPITERITKPKAEYAMRDLWSGDVQGIIMEYAKKKGVLKRGYDIELVKIT